MCAVGDMVLNQMAHTPAMVRGTTIITRVNVGPEQNLCCELLV